MLKLARIAGLILLLIAYPAMSDDNPLFQDTPLLNYNALNAANLVPAMETVLQQFDTRLAAIVVASPPSWSNTIEPLQEATNAVSRIWNVISHLNAVNGTPEIQNAYQNLLPKVTGFYSKIMLNKDLYKAYKAISLGPEFSKLNSEQQVHIKNMLKDFHLSGADLDSADAERLQQLNTTLQQLARKFTEDVNDATQSWQYIIPPENEAMLLGVPDSVKNAADATAKKLGKKGWVLTLDPDTVALVSSYATNRELRQTIFKAYNTLASDQAENVNDRKWDNTQIIAQIIALRKELATLLGFNSYLDYVLASKGSQTQTQVLTFLNDLAKQTKPAAQQEYKTLQDFANTHDKIDKLEPWDIPYYAQKAKNQTFDLSPQELRQYFPKNTVIQGLFTLVNLLYNISFKEVKDASSWNSAVQVFAISDQNQQLRGFFYLDLFARKNKRTGTWTSSYTSRFRFSDGAIQLPVAFINASFSGADDNLLEYNDVISLFHEFGGMLAQILSLNDYPDISGIGNTTINTSEMAAEFMQTWFWVYDVMLDISKNINDGQALPQDTFQKMLAEKNYNAAIRLLSQIELALFDFHLHANTQDYLNKAPLAILNDIHQKNSVIPHHDFERFPNHFMYDFSTANAANYYEYQWATVLAADAFAAFKEHSLFDPTTGRKFLQSFLEQTGEESTLDLFEQFRGREPSSVPYLQQEGILATQ